MRLCFLNLKRSWMACNLHTGMRYSHFINWPLATIFISNPDRRLVKAFIDRVDELFHLTICSSLIKDMSKEFNFVFLEIWLLYLGRGHLKSGHFLAELSANPVPPLAPIIWQTFRGYLKINLLQNFSFFRLEQNEYDRSGER